jgi:MFS family permease
MFFFNTLYIQRVLGFGPLAAGLAFLPFTAGIMVSAGLASRFAPRVGVRPIAIAGLVVSAAGMLLLMGVPADGTYAVDVLPALILTALGMGAVFVPLTLIATTGLGNDDQGLASGLFNTSQQVGGALGLAILSTIAVDRTQSALGGLPNQPTAIDQANALVSGFKAAFFAGSILLIAGLVLLMTMLNRRDVEAVPTDEPLTASAG